MTGRFVYFIRPVGAPGPVKIGCSADPVNRLKQIMVWSPFPLEVAAAFPGGTELESALHGMFAPDRLHGEWFQPSPRMDEMIAAVRDGIAIERLFCAELALGKSAMRVASGKKSALTRRINLAEIAAERAGVAVIRPEWVRQIIAAYIGPDKLGPTPEHEALVDLYARQLRSGIAA